MSPVGNYLSTREAAERLGVRPDTVRRMIDKGEFGRPGPFTPGAPKTNIFGQFLIPIRTVERVAQEREAVAARRALDRALEAERRERRRAERERPRAGVPPEWARLRRGRDRVPRDVARQAVAGGVPDPSQWRGVTWYAGSWRFEVVDDQDRRHTIQLADHGDWKEAIGWVRKHVRLEFDEVEYEPPTR